MRFSWASTGQVLEDGRGFDKPVDLVAAFLGYAYYHGSNGALRAHGFSYNGNGIASEINDLISVAPRIPYERMSLIKWNRLFYIKGFLVDNEKVDVLERWRETAGKAIGERYGLEGPIDAEGFILSIVNQMDPDSDHGNLTFGDALGSVVAKVCEPCNEIFDQPDIGFTDDGRIVWTNN